MNKAYYLINKNALLISKEGPALELLMDWIADNAPDGLHIFITQDKSNELPVYRVQLYPISPFLPKIQREPVPDSTYTAIVQHINDNL